MLTYDTILQGDGATHQDAIDFAQGYDFSEDEETEFKGTHVTYVDTVDSIDIYYNYGADYYFFAQNK